ncbi:CaiB/BaiF CoA transferase family protein [Nonomuraea lactucae]|uniref:CaiB/BaiF CoA transferase family protein n=1 Tax=Nonomuraea lactucae TaxID=2249762 RepID=UPI000DE3AE42|nr:CoA transferase [Nonomuraea lactucae]
MAIKPLDGITVLDFTRVLAGPMATQILAELGATVIKIERPSVGDETRRFEPRLPHGESAYFFAFNRGKRSVTLNLKDHRGQKMARELARRADVVMENFLPGTMEKMGLGYETLAFDNPGLVYVSLTGFGQAGPYSARKGYDTIFQALSGIIALTGHPDGPPAKAGVPVSDLTSGLWAVIASLAGLAGRSAGRDGRGCHLDVAMMDVQVSLLALAAARLFVHDEDTGRAGTAHPGRVPSEAFQCADGRWLHISAGDQHWIPLCRVLRLDELAADESLLSNAGRLAARVRISDALRQAISLRDRASLAEALRLADVPAGEVNTVREVLHDPHTTARDLVGRFTHPTEGSFPALRTPLRVIGAEIPEISTPPLIGADTERVLKEDLGLDEAQIAELRTAGVI